MLDNEQTGDSGRSIPGAGEDTTTYEDWELESKALYFLKNCKRKQYRAMSKEDREEYCKLKAAAARRYAENMISTGMWPTMAWNMAIRSEILESETD